MELCFSIVVVSLNPGDGLRKTIDSICAQNPKNTQVIIKDGMSKDGAIEALIDAGYLEKYPWIWVERSKDSSIYDAMNQGIEKARKKQKSSYILFLNCGDTFYHNQVLENIGEQIKEYREQENSKMPLIFYGNQYNCMQDAVVYSTPVINDFACYRNLPCHQVCFYDDRLFEKRGYDTAYKVRADYEHFLYSLYKEKAKAIYVPTIVAAYEGGGYSETKESLLVSAKEHKKIAKEYLGNKKVKKYQMIMWLTLAPLRTKIAGSPRLSKIYNKIKTKIYTMIGR